MTKKIAIIPSHLLNVDEIESKFPNVEIFSAEDESEFPHYSLCSPEAFSFFVDLSQNVETGKWGMEKSFEKKFFVASLRNESAISLFDSDETLLDKLKESEVELLSYQDVYADALKHRLGIQPKISVFLESAEVLGAIDQLLDQTRAILAGVAEQSGDCHLAFNIIGLANQNNNFGSVRIFVPALTGLVGLHVVDADSKLDESAHQSTSFWNRDGEFSLVESTLPIVPTVVVKKDFESLSLVITVVDPTALYTGYVSRVLTKLAQL